MWVWVWVESKDLGFIVDSLHLGVLKNEHCNSKLSSPMSYKFESRAKAVSQLGSKPSPTFLISLETERRSDVFHRQLF